MSDPLYVLCPSCGKTTRVPSGQAGTPVCEMCHAPLPDPRDLRPMPSPWRTRLPFDVPHSFDGWMRLFFEGQRRLYVLAALIGLVVLTLLVQGRSGPRSPTETACLAGDQQQCVALGALFETGRYLDGDLSRAVSLYAGACRAGENTGCLALQRFLISHPSLNRPCEDKDPSCIQLDGLAPPVAVADPDPLFTWAFSCQPEAGEPTALAETSADVANRWIGLSAALVLRHNPDIDPLQDLALRVTLGNTFLTSASLASSRWSGTRFKRADDPTLTPREADFVAQGFDYLATAEFRYRLAPGESEPETALPPDLSYTNPYVLNSDFTLKGALAHLRPRLQAQLLTCLSQREPAQ